MKTKCAAWSAVMMTAAVAVVFSGVAQAQTQLLLPNGKPALREQLWVNAYAVPTPDVVLMVMRQTCPKAQPIMQGRSCVDLATRAVYIARKGGSATLAKLLGYLFNRSEMNKSERRRFVRLDGLHALQSEPDRFAAAFQRCALQSGDSPICSLIQRVGGGPPVQPQVQFGPDTTAMARARQIAVAYWGATPCGGEPIPVSWGVLPTGYNSVSTWSTVVGDPYAHPDLYTHCSITFSAKALFDWPKFCTVVVHEYGHLTGHPHSGDPTNVMAPFYKQPVAPCTGSQ